MKKSTFLNLSISDWAKGLIVTVITAVLTGVYTSVEAGAFPTTWAQWKVITLAGLGAGIAYILKNFATNSQGDILKKEPPVQ